MPATRVPALVDGAGLAAEIAAELASGSPALPVYRVEPTGPFEDAPNVTDKQCAPGNPTRSYRSHSPLRVIGEVERLDAPDAGSPSPAGTG